MSEPGAVSADRSRRRTGPLRAAVGLSLAADRRATVITLVSFALRPAGMVLTAWTAAVLIDAAVDQDHGRVLLAVIATALVAGLTAGSAPLAVELSARMIEATAAAVDDRLMGLVGGLHGVDRLEDPELLDQVEVLHQERVYLAEGADALSLVLGVSVRAVLTAVLLAAVNPLLLLTPLLAVPSVLASQRAHNRRAAAVEAGAGAARLAEHLYRTAMTPAAAEEMRVFGVAPRLRAEHERARAEADRPVVTAVVRSLGITSVGGLVFVAGFVLSLVIVARGFAAGQTSVGDVVLTLSLVTSLNLQVATAIAFLGFLQQTRSSSARLLALEQTCRVDALSWTGTGEPPARLARGIRLDGLGFRYPGGTRDALRDVDLWLPAGSVVAVVGHNGAGKSTLIKLLAGLYRPGTGQILLDDVPLASLRPAGWRSATSACFQDFGRLEFTLGQSVGVGDLARAGDDEAVLEALRQGAALELAERLPQGLQTPLGRSFEDGTELSGGQWQRVALARARMRPEPLLLVLDEPAAAIDPLAEEELLRRYVSAARETSRASNGITLFASHRLSTARLADVIVVIAEARLAEVGTHDELMGRPGGIYREMFAAQARGYGWGEQQPDPDLVTTEVDGG